MIAERKSEEKQPEMDTMANTLNPTNLLVIPPDGGWGWVIVAASFFINGLVDGLASIFGVFQPEFLKAFGASRGKTALAGSLMAGTFLLSGPVVSGLVNAVGCRVVTILGAFIASAAYIIATFSSNMDILIMTYGVLAGMGVGMFYLPAMVMVGYYFERRRALATGIACSGAGFGMLMLAPVSAALLNVTTWQNALYAISCIVLSAVFLGALMRPLSNSYTPEGAIEMECDDKSSKMDSESHIEKKFVKDTLLESDPPKKISKNGFMPGRLMKGNISGASISATATMLSQDLEAGSKSHFADDTGSNTPRQYIDNHTESKSHMQQFGKKTGSKPIRQHLDSYTGDYGQDYDWVAHYSAESLTFKNKNHFVSNPANESFKTQPDSKKSTLFNTQFYSLPSIPLTFHCQDHTVYSHNKANAHNKSKLKTARLVSTTQSCNNLPFHSSHILIEDKKKLVEELNRPLNRLDIFYGSSALTLPEFKEQSDLDMVSVLERMTMIPKELVTPVKSRGCLHPAVLQAIKQMLDFSILASPSFLVIALASAFIQVAYFIPVMFVTEYAVSLGADDKQAAALVSIIGACNGIGRAVHGALANHPRVSTLHLNNWTLVVAGASTVLCPVLCHNYATLIAYATTFGFFVAGFAPLSNLLLVQYLGIAKLTNAFGLLSMVRGVATCVGPPIAGILLEKSNSFSYTFYFAGSLFILAGFTHYLLPLVTRCSCQHKMNTSQPSTGQIHLTKRTLS